MDIVNEMTRQSVAALCGAVEHIAEQKGLAAEHVSMVGALAAFELAARSMGPVAAIEYVRDVADVLERELLPRA